MKEIASKRGGVARTAGKQWPKLVAMLVSASLVAGPAMANPTGAQVISGQATFSTQGNALTVTNTPGAIINWQNFSINPNEITRFVQQNSSSSVLNRITGQNPSQILGTLQSNGRVFLINPNGIVFGQGAQINVNGLVASTLNISNEDFAAGRMNFIKAGALAGDLKNQGSIATPDGGQVVLIAPNVENSGVITSPKGEVLLAAGHSVRLVDTSNPSVQVVVSAPDHQALNLGQVIAQGGKIGIYGGLITQRGTVNANSAVVGENGKIVFKSSGDTVLDSGSITSATGAGSGGEIQVLGNRVGLFGNAQVDASGQKAGGTVLVGGDYQGKNASIQNAKQTLMSADAGIKADAVSEGNGGKIILWGDDSAQVHGKISARGGAQSGNGGFIETSSHDLNVNGASVDARASNGKNGTWLLDPYDLRVVAGGGGSTTVAFSDPNTDVGNNRTDVYASTINGAGANVILQAQHNLDIQATVNITAAGVGFTAQAGNDITVSAPVTTNGGKIKIIANDAGGPASGIGMLNLSGSLTSNGGMIELAGKTVSLNSGVHSNNGHIDIASGGGGISASSTGSIAAGTGTVKLTSTGAVSSNTGGTVTGNDLVITANGNISVTGANVSGLGVTQNCSTCTVHVQNNTGNLSLSGINAPGNAITLTNTSGAISGGTITGSSLTITGYGNINVSTAVGSLSAYASDIGQISVTNSGNLSVNTVDAGTNVSISTAGSMSIVGSVTTNSNNAAGTYTFTAISGNMDVTGSISNVNGSVNLTADPVNGPYTLTTGGSSTISSTGGTIGLTAGGAITLSGSIGANKTVSANQYATTTTSTTTSSTSTTSTSTSSTTSSTSTTSTTSTSSTITTTSSTTSTTLKPPTSDCVANPSLSTCQTSSSSSQTQVDKTVIDSLNSASKDLSTSGDGKLSSTKIGTIGNALNEDKKDGEKETDTVVAAGGGQSGAKKNAGKKLFCN